MESVASLAGTWKVYAPFQATVNEGKDLELTSGEFSTVIPRETFSMPLREWLQQQFATGALEVQARIRDNVKEYGQEQEAVVHFQVQAPAPFNRSYGASLDIPVAYLQGLAEYLEVGLGNVNLNPPAGLVEPPF